MLGFCCKHRLQKRDARSLSALLSRPHGIPAQVLIQTVRPVDFMLLICSSLLTWFFYEVGWFLDYNPTLIISPVIFPITFTISSAYARREQALASLGAFRYPLPHVPSAGGGAPDGGSRAFAFGGACGGAERGSADRCHGCVLGPHGVPPLFWGVRSADVQSGLRVGMTQTHRLEPQITGGGSVGAFNSPCHSSVAIASGAENNGTGVKNGEILPLTQGTQ